MPRRTRPRGRPPHPDVLTPAEWSVLVLVQRGLANPEIARTRRCSVDAVRYHIENITEKLGLPGREALRTWERTEGARADDAAVTLAEADWRIRMSATRPARGATLLANATTLLVHDVARTAAWFRDVLGFEIGEYLREHHTSAAETGLGEPVFVFVSRDGQRVALSKATGEGSAAGVRSNRDYKEIVGDLYFWVRGVERLYEDVRSRGAEMIEDLHERPYDMREFMVRTPDGHAITFGE